MVSYKTFIGSEILSIIDDVANFRINVFREFPYLYEGTLEGERSYLTHYAQNPGSFIALAYEDDTPVGATTCTPFEEAESYWQEAFLSHNLDPRLFCYFGESILLKEFRGRGIGKSFFDLREAHARFLGKTQACFCAVDRLDTHPLRPQDYRPLDTFWQSRGYTKHPDIKATVSWHQIDNTPDQETENTLSFWINPSI